MSTSRYIMVFEAIREILENQNVENLTITNIAKQCHLHPSTVNYYFNGKSDMFMRFYTYITNMGYKSLPEYFHNVPEDAEEAVKAFARIVDLELFRADHTSRAQLKLHQHMLGSFDSKPDIRYYLTEKEEAHQAFIRETVYRYLDAGIVDPKGLEEGLSSILLASMGQMLLHFYYKPSAESEQMVRLRSRILHVMVRERYHRILARYLQL